MINGKTFLSMINIEQIYSINKGHGCRDISSQNKTSKPKPPPSSSSSSSSSSLRPYMATKTSLSRKDMITSFVISEGQGVKGLADINIKSLPKEYIQPKEERHNNEKVVKSSSIPIIDMKNLKDPKVEKLVCDAARTWGFFQVVNHGVPSQVLEDVTAAAHRFFELPPWEKRLYSKENSASNRVRYGTSFIPELEQTLEWKDYLSFLYVSDHDALLWPSSCRDEALQYMKDAQNVARHLLKILMKGLNIDDEMTEKREMELMGSKRINLNYYPKCPNPELTVGVGRHSDVSTLTILLQDDVGGLYVRELEGDGWIHVPPIKGALVINVGDALQIFSNGKYKSVEHRVIPNALCNRVSIPVFVNPMPNTLIGPFPELIRRGNKMIYKHVLYSDYVKNFYKKAHDGKSTIDYATI